MTTGSLERVIVACAARIASELSYIGQQIHVHGQGEGFVTPEEVEKELWDAVGKAELRARVERMDAHRSA